MGTSSFAALAGMGLFAILIMAVVGVLVGALVLSVAFRLVVGFMPAYLRSIGAVLLTLVGAIVVSLVLRMILGGASGTLLTLAAQFLIGAAVVNFLLKAQDGSQIGFGKACIVQLVYSVIGFVVAVVIGIVVGLMFGSMLAGMHPG